MQLIEESVCNCLFIKFGKYGFMVDTFLLLFLIFLYIKYYEMLFLALIREVIRDMRILSEFLASFCINSGIFCLRGASVLILGLKIVSF